MSLEGTYVKIVTTFAWQLKPNTMMGMANKAPKSQRKRRMSSKGAGLSEVICHALTTMATAVYKNPMTAAMLTCDKPPK